MIKSLKKYQLKLTPFQATKNWELDNVFNDNLLLLEQTGSDGSDVALALEFLEYGDGSGFPETGSSCDIALEQQDADKVSFKEGQNITGIFYPDLDPKNLDGTYKRLVYAQYKTAFYNDFRNPTEIWGVENIDFELSKTKRFLSPGIQVYEIPRLSFGDKIVPQSITMYNRSSDNEYIVTDDGNGNLIAGTNLFSNVQEIGSHPNTFLDGENFSCSDYWNSINGPSPAPPMPAVVHMTVGDVVFNFINAPSGWWLSEINSTQTDTVSIGSWTGDYSGTFNVNGFYQVLISKTAGDAAAYYATGDGTNISHPVLILFNVGGGSGIYFLAYQPPQNTQLIWYSGIGFAGSPTYDGHNLDLAGSASMWRTTDSAQIAVPIVLY